MSCRASGHDAGGGPVGEGGGGGGCSGRPTLPGGVGVSVV
ncbi:hypothetical protein BN2537_13609 [Streptomyces venezuelae]|nr:hypothetical protein BN2537_13609 [Streptomyces venezuelae]